VDAASAIDAQGTPSDVAWGLVGQEIDRTF
jgi:hypothetical protein